MPIIKQQPKPSYNKTTTRLQFRPTTCKNFGVSKRPTSRPASAKEIFESCNQKRNEAAWKMEEKLSDVSAMKKREWEAQFYTSLAFKKRDDKIVDWREEEEKERKLNERREKLRKLLAEDEKLYEKEREAKIKANQISSKNLSDPEIELLRRRLQELKKQNEEERKKLSEKLSFEAWRKNNSDLRQVESERLSRFIRDTWDDQVKWREKERKAKEDEKKKFEMEMENKRKKEEEEEKKKMDGIREMQFKWRTHLEKQIEDLRRREDEEEEICKKEIEIEKERLKLQNIIHKRERIIRERERRNLELFWAKQCQLKLKQKSICVKEELLNEEAILEDLFSVTDDQKYDQKAFKEEREYMKKMLEEQKRLEILREKEYDLLFSEEAETMWRKREAEWQREQEARDRLFGEVIKGLQKQITEKLKFTKKRLQSLQSEKEELSYSIRNSEMEIEKKEREIKSQNEVKKVPSVSFCKSERDIRRQELLMNRSVEERQLEIARLEEEMQKLWMESYVPPKFGRKKVNW